jgi:hypothetical protein
VNFNLCKGVCCFQEFGQSVLSNHKLANTLWNLAKDGQNRVYSGPRSVLRPLPTVALGKACRGVIITVLPLITMQNELAITFPHDGGQREYGWVYMPYCLQPMGADRWVILNRGYKPVGVHTRAHLDYSPFVTELHVKRSSLRHLDWRPDKALSTLEWPHAILLYNDGCDPTRSADAMERYLKRVQHLMGMKVQSPQEL